MTDYTGNPLSKEDCIYWKENNESFDGHNGKIGIITQINDQTGLATVRYLSNDGMNFYGI